MTRGRFVFALLVMLLSEPVRAADLQADAQRALEKGLAYLMTAQEKDGGWHSKTYGSMRGGAANTAMVLYAVANSSPAFHKQYRVRLLRGYAFLQTGIRKKGYVAAPDGTLDYPSYATAMTLVAVRKLQIEVPAEETQSMTRFLLNAQLDERRKFKPESPHYGGWDLMGASEIQGLTSGTNVSVSRFALEALADGKDVTTVKALLAAQSWITGCQNIKSDGGFAFTPDRMSLNNKAQWTDKQRVSPRSYGTATCDGLHCLLAMGAKPNDPRVVAAIAWLVAREDLEEVPGFEGLPKTLDWQAGLRYYYYASLAKSLPYFPKDSAKARRQALLKKLVELQRDNGSWRNESTRMREDDPLIATPLAIMALSELLREDK